MNHHVEYVKYLVAKHGPDPEDYKDLDSWIIEILDDVNKNRISRKEIDEILESFGKAISTKTMQGFAFQKPHGYAGDFEIINRIYESYISEDKSLSKWDIYMQQQISSHALRNRTRYFSEQIYKSVQQITNQVTQVLNLASGPGRDMAHFFQSYPSLAASVQFDCVEQDQNAIHYASNLYSAHLDQITFIQKNVLFFKSKKTYDLIWSAGLFDYFNDSIFIKILERSKKMLSNGGLIVIGIF